MNRVKEKHSAIEVASPPEIPGLNPLNEPNLIGVGKNTFRCNIGGLLKEAFIVHFSEIEGHSVTFANGETRPGMKTLRGSFKGVSGAKAKGQQVYLEGLIWAENQRRERERTALRPRLRVVCGYREVGKRAAA